MDKSQDNPVEEIEVEAIVHTPKADRNKAKSPINKKRKCLSSPEVRNPKVPKVSKKQKDSDRKKANFDEITIIDDENIPSNTGKIEKNVLAKKTPESNKKASGKGSAKSKKSEIRIQANAISKFFVKKLNPIDKNSDSENEVTVIDQKSDKTKDSSKLEAEIAVGVEKDINAEKVIKSLPSKDGKTDDEKAHELQVSAEEQITEKTANDNKTAAVTDESDENQDSSGDFLRKENKNENIKLNKKNEKLQNDSSHLSANSQEHEVRSESLAEKVELKDAKVNGKVDETDINKSNIDDTEVMEIDSESKSDGDSVSENDDSSHSEANSKKTGNEETTTDYDVEKNPLTPLNKNSLQPMLKVRRLTPKQIERRKFQEKKRGEKERKLNEEREMKRREKEERRREREKKEQDLKEKKQRQKEYKDLKKMTIMEIKQKEKEEKEEERRKREKTKEEEKQRKEELQRIREEAKDEEKRRKEEEKLEAERKKQKAAAKFASFFVTKKPLETKPIEEVKKFEKQNFMPFEVKADMRLAPLTRRHLSKCDKEKLAEFIEEQSGNKENLYIEELKNKRFELRKSGKTWPYETNDDIVILEYDGEENSNIVQAGKTERHRAKLFLFAENRRPPYWGTWRKKSKNVKPRRPFAKDTVSFDYEVDSDDEWEEEEPGESLHGTDDEKDKEEDAEDEYDVDNDFMVPHGYLSEEEINPDEEEEDDLNPETQKAKLKVLGEEFEAERKLKTEKLKPKVIGCMWLDENNSYPENAPARTMQFLTARHAWVREVPIVISPAPVEVDNGNDECGTPSTKNCAASSARKAKSIEEAMPDFIRMMHGNRHSRFFLVKEFLEFWNKKNGSEKPIPKSKLQAKINEIATWKACPEPGPMKDKLCWFVNEECRKKYFPDENLPLPNRWTYTLAPKKKNIEFDEPEKIDEKEKEKDKDRKGPPLITQFTKTLSAEEMQKQLEDKPSTSGIKMNDKTETASTTISKTPGSSKPPKRAVLISVPRGESLPKSPRISLIDKFITKDGEKPSAKAEHTKTVSIADDNQDCVIIDSDDDDIISLTPDPTEKKLLKESEVGNKVEIKDVGNAGTSANVTK